jgi:hypothetical protein
LVRVPQQQQQQQQEVAKPDPYVRPAPSGHLPKEITLYQYEVCPFCCKVKAFLDYHKVGTPLCYSAAAAAGTYTPT